MGSGTTTSIQLDKMGKGLLGSCYIGALPRDSTKIRSMKPGQCCIANTHAHWQPGEHWMAIVNDKSEGFCAYDSFGRRVASWAKDSELDAEQVILELNCGQRCLAWLLVWKNSGIDAAMKI